MAYLVYQIGVMVCFVCGIALALVGLVRNECPFFGRGVYSDSVVTRVASGIGIGVVWPVFLPATFLWWLFARVAKKKDDGSKQ
jgi:hypothetical protein